MIAKFLVCVSILFRLCDAVSKGIRKYYTKFFLVNNKLIMKKKLKVCLLEKNYEDYSANLRLKFDNAQLEIVNNSILDFE